MKKVFTFLVPITIGILLTSTLWAQSPQKMSYQAVIRNSSDALVANTQIGMQISILQGSSDGMAVYVETQLPTTNTNGLVSVEIGAGEVESGSFADIDWQNGPYFIKTETDPDGGTSYSITGISQILSVPFALHAQTAESVNETDPDFNAWDKSTGIEITESQISDLDKFTTDDEIDPVFNAWDKSTGIEISKTQITDLDNFTNDDETDPVFAASAAADISDADKERWDNKSSFSGSYADLSDKPTALSDFDNDAGYQLAADDEDTNPENEIQHLYARSDNKLGLTGSGRFVDISASESDPAYTSSQAFKITADDITHLGNLSGTNTGDQDISGITTNATAITAIETEQTTQNDAIALNTAKTGITTAQANAIVTNTGKDTTGIYHSNRTALDVVTGVNTGDQDISGIAANATAITAIETEQTTQNDAIALNTAKTGITTAQANAIVANTGKDTTGIYHSNRTALDAVTGVNTGDQDLSALATKTALGDSTAQVRSEIPDVSGFLTSESQNLNNVLTLNNSAENKKITNLANPTEAQDAATKAYVDALLARIETLELLNNGFTDTRDNNHYDVVKIGEQVWMAENLKYLPSVVSLETYSDTTAYYYVYDYYGTNVTAAKATANYITYGVIYNWTAATTACPSGWHLPSDANWTELTTYLGGAAISGGNLKETGTTHWASPNTGATNETGFTALPGGALQSNSFSGIGDVGVWWSATEGSAVDAWYRYIFYEYSYVGRGDYGKGCGFSVRCVRD